MSEEETPRRKNGPQWKLRRLEPHVGFCRRCLQNTSEYSVVEVGDGQGEVRDWIMCNSCVNRPDHARWLREREKDRARYVLKETRERMKNLKYYIDPEKTDAAVAESIAQAMNGERGTGARYQICVGPSVNTTKTLFTPQEFAALERRERELVAEEKTKRDREAAYAKQSASTPRNESSAESGP